MQAYDAFAQVAARGVLPMDAELYLHEFRRGLLALPESERASIVDEVREQVAAQAGLGAESLAKLLARMGPPDRLARQFTLSFELAASVHRANPLALLMVVLASATINLWAMAGALVALFLYMMGAAFALIALLKPVIPRYTGAWIMPDGDVNIGIIINHTGEEVLGYWIIPLAVLAAVVCFVGANMLLRASGRRLMAAARRWTRA